MAPHHKMNGRDVCRWLTLVCVLAIFAIAAESARAAPPIFGDQFEWPDVDVNAIPDARLTSVIESARDAARDAENRSAMGQRAASQAKRRCSIRAAFGRSEKSETIDSGTVLTGRPVDGENGPMLGVVSYPTGATMTGIFGPDTGIYSPAPESRLIEFSGWVFGATKSTPTPMAGVFTLKNGESFTGSYNAGTNAEGIYSSANGERRFVGRLDMSGSSIRPTLGVLEDRKRHVLAVVLN